MAGPARNVAERVAAVETDTLESVFGILHNGMRMERARRLEDLWSHIHCLGILAETGSFTAAALRLQLSKASVSQRIAELEKAVGLPLVRRTTRGVSLTEAGAHLVEQTAAAFQRIEAGYSAVKDLSAGPRGVLAMTAPVALGRQVIAPLIPAFLKRYPDVQIQLDLSDRLAALATEGFDLAIRHVAEVPDTHVASLIGEIRSVLVATPRYLAEHGMPAVPADLERHDCIHYLRRSGAAAWAFRRPGRTSACRCRSGAASRPTTTRYCERPHWVPSASRCCPISARVRRCATGHWSRCWAIGGWKATSPTGCTRSGPIRRMCRAWCPCSSSMSGRPCPRLKHSRSLPSQSVGQRPVMRPGHGPGLGDAAQAQLPVKTRAGVLVQRGDMRQVDDGRAMNAGK